MHMNDFTASITKKLHLFFQNVFLITQGESQITETLFIPDHIICQQVSDDSCLFPCTQHSIFAEP